MQPPVINDIKAYLQQHERKDLLRFLTCGSVDDGKSTLIGRLLFDSKTIYEDQLAAIRRDSVAHGTTGTDFDPALLTDGLKAEREQGITIDVAYRYFSTDKRKFIIADTPGHEQYTRNMATGASNCNLAILLVDARHGVVTQTKRHSFIVSLLGIRHIVVAVNKMDLVDWSEERFEQIRHDFNAFAARLQFGDVHFIPLSALHGDNVVDRSLHAPWYDGPTLLHHLEQVNLTSDRNLIDFRLPIQLVVRPSLNFRGFAGTIASGVLRCGDEVIALPSNMRSRVKEIFGPQGPLPSAFSPMPVTVTLEDEIDLSRGDMLAHPNNLPRVDHELEAMVVWMNEKPGSEGTTYLLKQSTRFTPATLDEIRYRVDVNTGHRATENLTELRLNEIGRVRITSHRQLAFDSYRKNPATGSFILVDRLTNATVAAGMIVDRPVAVSTPSLPPPVSENIRRERGLVSREDRERLLAQKGATIWLTGLSGSGKSTISQAVEKALVAAGHIAFILDGDNVRHGLNRDLGFSAKDRTENIRRVAEVARLFNDAGVIVLTSFISPFRADRELARQIIGPEHFLEIFVNTPLEVCEQRDPKGLYKKARSGEIRQFTGISDPYEPPTAPLLALAGHDRPVEESTDAVMKLLRTKGIIP
ncbi:MAG: sulfate adenylyltransferase subunit CysN [Verrucomicrobiia bacterium]